MLIDGLASFLPKEGFFIEPFYGKGNLEKSLKISFNEFYDIASEDETHRRDTLLNPPDYKNKWVITNPPYLAKNKAKDKTLFKKYPHDDLYKIAMSTMIGCSGGILIVPLNFFTDERSSTLRREFLSKYKVLRLNIFLDSMFDNTDYNVCSFFFEQKKCDEDNLEIDVHTYENKKEVECFTLNLKEKYNYRVGGEFFDTLKNTKAIFSRITEEKRQNSTHINIVCIDKTDEPLHFYYAENPYYGKQTDRNIATLSFEGSLTEEFEKLLIETANKLINSFRKETHNLCFSNYRDRHRKRIGFTEAYKIISMVYYSLKK